MKYFNSPYSCITYVHFDDIIEYIKYNHSHNYKQVHYTVGNKDTPPEQIGLYFTSPEIFIIDGLHKLYGYSSRASIEFEFFEEDLRKEGFIIDQTAREFLKFLEEVVSECPAYYRLTRTLNLIL